MPNESLKEIAKLSLNKERIQCFLTPDDIDRITDEIRKNKCASYVILDKKQVAENLLNIRRIEIVSLLNRIENLAIDKIGEDDRVMWYYENILSFSDILVEKYGDACQLCLYRQILSGDPNPRKEVIIIDFAGKDSILSNLIIQQKKLLNIKKELSC